MKQYTFVLNFGYVESSRLSYFPFSSLNKYKDAKEALVDLAKFLQEQYNLGHATEPKKYDHQGPAKEPKRPDRSIILLGDMYVFKHIFRSINFVWEFGRMSQRLMILL